MTAYLRSWLPSSFLSPADPEPPSEPSISITIDDADEGGSSGEETERGDSNDNDDDLPPAFPSLNSAQRTKPESSTKARSLLPDVALMPPPALPASVSGSVSLGVPSTGPPRSASNTLALPLTTTKPPPKPSKKRDKVALKPGHGPLDWANLKSSGKDLRGVDSLMKVTPSILKQHNKPDDAWTAINGKVYNITAYLPFHPGGEKELMRVAGRDGTKLFALTHAWVNADFMLDHCMVGFLVPERP